LCCLAMQELLYDKVVRTCCTGEGWPGQLGTARRCMPRCSKALDINTI
jgi:hypothetical protein